MRLGLTLLVAAPAFAIDQASKWWVVEVLDLAERQFMSAGPFLNFVLAYNTGVNFGLFASGSPLQAMGLAALAAAVSAGLLIWSARTTDTVLACGCGLIVGGALANAFDRLRHGAVMDFINMDCCGIGNPYAFNLADVAIFMGAGLVAWSAWSDGGDDDETDAESRA